MFTFWPLLVKLYNTSSRLRPVRVTSPFRLTFELKPKLDTTGLPLPSPTIVRTSPSLLVEVVNQTEAA